MLVTEKPATVTGAQGGCRRHVGNPARETTGKVNCNTVGGVS